MLGEGLREVSKMRSNPPRTHYVRRPSQEGMTHPGLRPPLPGGEVSSVADQAGSWAFADIHHQGL